MQSHANSLGQLLDSLSILEIGSQNEIGGRRGVLSATLHGGFQPYPAAPPDVERHGPPAGNPIEIQVRGEVETDIMSVVTGIVKIANSLPGVSDVAHDLDDGKREMHVVVDETAAARYGLDVTTIGTAVRNAFGGGIATKLQRGEDEIDVVVRLPDSQRQKSAEIEALTVAWLETEDCPASADSLCTDT